MHAALPGLTSRQVARAVGRAWTLYGGPAGARLDVSVLAGAEHTRLHARHSGDPRATDVLAFPYHEADLYGEILVNRDFALEEARRRGCSALDEVLLYAVHGALHLLGFRDDSAAARVQMRAAEARVLAPQGRRKKFRKT